MALNVLVVDDSSVMRGLVKRVLNISGLPIGEIFEAENGQEGLDVLEDNWIDLALVDIHMPVMTGEEMIENVRSNPDVADLAIIVVSSESSDSRIDRLLNEFGVGFVHKPFTPEDLREAVVQLIGEVDND